MAERFATLAACKAGRLKRADLFAKMAFRYVDRPLQSQQYQKISLAYTTDLDNLRRHSSEKCQAYQSSITHQFVFTEIAARQYCLDPHQANKQ
jgi:hypothetical protein